MNVFVCWDHHPDSVDEVTIEGNVKNAKCYDNYFMLDIPDLKRGSGKCVGTFTVKEDN